MLLQTSYQPFDQLGYKPTAGESEFLSNQSHSRSHHKGYVVFASAFEQPAQPRLHQGSGG